jgi:hypothetical protein
MPPYACCKFCWISSCSPVPHCGYICVYGTSWVTGKRYWSEGIGVHIMSCNGDHRTTPQCSQTWKTSLMEKIALFWILLVHSPFHLALQIVLWCWVQQTHHLPVQNHEYCLDLYQWDASIILWQDSHILTYIRTCPVLMSSLPFTG